MNKPLRYSGIIVISVLVLATTGLGTFLFVLSRSQALLSGTESATGLSEPVSIGRDSLGTPTINGTTMRDLATAMGFVHAQDRFFQMDLARRTAAGELSEIFGPAAVHTDKMIKLHEFRMRSRQVLGRLDPDKRTFLEAYVNGVNSGLVGLRAKPFEYTLLRIHPVEWKAEDSILVVYSMALGLADMGGIYEYSTAGVRNVFGEKASNFFSPFGSEWDAALDGTTLNNPPIPLSGDVHFELMTNVPAGLRAGQIADTATFSRQHRELPWASNSFALNGAHTATNIPMIAGDFHSALRVPNMWYRLRILLNSNPGRTERDVIGVSLPGIPAVLAGSNGRIAWTFTNAHIDTTDLVVIPPLRKSASQEASTESSVKREPHEQLIQVKGHKPEKLTTMWTQWGPIIRPYEGTDLALRWSMHDAEAINLDLCDIIEANSVSDALAVAKRSGVPPLNIVAVDREGNIGWTICGKIPRRIGMDGRFPTEWTSGTRGWTGYLRPEEYPEIINPPTGRLWTANNRTVGGHELAKLGDGRYDLGARATQIKSDLAKTERATTNDLLAIQLDDRATFLDRWQKLLTATLNATGVESSPERTELKQLLSDWNGHASIDSTSYKAVRMWRLRVAHLVMQPIAAACSNGYPGFDYTALQFEHPVWKLINEKPVHLLNPNFKSWDLLLLRAADDIIQSMKKESSGSPMATWGDQNRAEIRHPFSRALPSMMSKYLDMPNDKLPGDHDMPRVQAGNYGASMRFVVSPGRENEGIFNMPGGQSGNPFSPFYREGHADWVAGKATPLLPGPTLYTLTLRPK